MKRALATVLLVAALAPVRAHASTDMAILVEMLAAEIAQAAQIAQQVEQAIEMVRMIKSQVDTARAVYDGIEDLKDYSWEELKGDMKEGAFSGVYSQYPGIEDVVDDTRNFREVFDPTVGRANRASRQRIRTFVIDTYGAVPELGSKMQHRLMPEIVSQQEMDMAFKRAAQVQGINEEDLQPMIDRLMDKTKDANPGQSQILAAQAAALQAQQQRIANDVASELLRLQAIRLSEENRIRKQKIQENVRIARQLVESFMPPEDKERESVEMNLEKEVPLEWGRGGR